MRDEMRDEGKRRVPAPLLVLIGLLGSIVVVESAITGANLWQALLIGLALGAACFRLLVLALPRIGVDAHTLNTPWRAAIGCTALAIPNIVLLLSAYWQVLWLAALVGGLCVLAISWPEQVAR